MMGTRYNENEVSGSTLCVVARFNGGDLEGQVVLPKVMQEPTFGTITLLGMAPKALSAGTCIFCRTLVRLTVDEGANSSTSAVTIAK